VINLFRRVTPVLLGLAMGACSSTPAAPPAPKARGEAAGIKVTATVEAIEMATRRVTLKGPKGASETYIAGPEVKRLAEIKVGDKITLDYKVVVIAELREPSEEEKKAPLVMVEGAERAPSDQPPGAAFARAVRVVALVEALDAASQTFSVRGPLGGMVQIRVDDAAKFAELKIWKAVVVTFAESALLTVEPSPK
jgi:hypothetical protein